MGMAKYYKLGHKFLINNLLTFLLLPTLVSTFLELLSLSLDNLQALCTTSMDAFPPGLSILLHSFTLTLLATIYFLSRPRPIYLIDFSCYKPPESFRFPLAKFMRISHLVTDFTPSSVEFQRKILQRSGLGEATSLPPTHHAIPFNPTMAASREESQLVIFSVLDSLFAKTGVDPRVDIGILVTNCSLFTPTPSLSSMVVNRYKMRSDIRSYSLGGMGCSAGPISVDLAKDQLLVHPNEYALIVTTEIITEHWYTGNNRSMLVANCLFRMGGAAALLSNRRRERRRAKYELVHVVRTHRGADDRAYRCVYQEEDGEGKVGVSLSKDLMEIAGEALKENITAIGPLVLPWSEQLMFLLSLVRKKRYVPNFKKAFDHFCIHAGGRAVIEELAKKLKLTAEQAEASRMTLHRFGNTSSSSPWYELSYTEAKGRMRKGDRVWQIGLGSGFKCNSAVWRCTRTVRSGEDNPWSDCIDVYPVQVKDVE